LPEAYVSWLEQVQKNCGHASVEKSLRIVIDFYSSFMESRPELEAPLFASLGAAVEATGAGADVDTLATPDLPPGPDPAALPLNTLDERKIVG
jgi:hypothetical protein